jgi:putative membrane protein
MRLRCVGTIAVVVLAGLMLPGGAAAQIDQNAGAMPGQQMPGEIERAPGTTPATNPRAANQPVSMRDSLGAPGQNGQQILDKQFMRSAAEGSLAEVKISTLATEKGTSNIKELAQKMVADHTAMNADLASVADSLGVLLPKKLNHDDQAEYDKLNGLSGKDFDTEYVTYIAKSHWHDAHNYRMEASIAVDPDLQSEVIKALGVMREHIGLIVKTATAEGIAMPERPRRPRPATSASNTGH